MAKSNKKKDAKGESTDSANDSGMTGSEVTGAGESGPDVKNQVVRMRAKYHDEVVPALMKEFGYTNPFQAPRVLKVVLNMGLGAAVVNPNIIKTAVEELTVIAGQRAVVTRAKKSIANYKLRAGVPIGCMVTLRRERMWAFLERLTHIALPRVRDFKGVSGRAFDGRGNFSLGLREQIIFPEINYDKIESVRGLNIAVTTSAETDKEGKALLKFLGMPFRN